MTTPSSSSEGMSRAPNNFMESMLKECQLFCDAANRFAKFSSSKLQELYRDLKAREYELRVQQLKFEGIGERIEAVLPKLGKVNKDKVISALAYEPRVLREPPPEMPFNVTPVHFDVEMFGFCNQMKRGWDDSDKKTKRQKVGVSDVFMGSSTNSLSSSSSTTAPPSAPTNTNEKICFYNDQSLSNNHVVPEDNLHSNTEDLVVAAMKASKILPETSVSNASVTSPSTVLLDSDWENANDAAMLLNSAVTCTAASLAILTTPLIVGEAWDQSNYNPDITQEEVRMTATSHDMEPLSEEAGSSKVGPNQLETNDMTGQSASVEVVTLQSASSPSFNEASVVLQIVNAPISERLAQIKDSQHGHDNTGTIERPNLDSASLQQVTFSSTPNTIQPSGGLPNPEATVVMMQDNQHSYYRLQDGDNNQTNPLLGVGILEPVELRVPLTESSLPESTCLTKQIRPFERVSFHDGAVQKKAIVAPMKKNELVTMPEPSTFSADLEPLDLSVNRNDDGTSLLDQSSSYPVEPLNLSTHQDNSYPLADAGTTTPSDVLELESSSTQHGSSTLYAINETPSIVGVGSTGSSRMESQIDTRSSFDHSVNEAGSSGSSGRPRVTDDQTSRVQDSSAGNSKRFILTRQDANATLDDVSSEEFENDSD